MRGRKTAEVTREQDRSQDTKLVCMGSIQTLDASRYQHSTLGSVINTRCPMGGLKPISVNIQDNGSTCIGGICSMYRNTSGNGGHPHQLSCLLACRLDFSRRIGFSLSCFSTEAANPENKSPSSLVHLCANMVTIPS